MPRASVPVRPVPARVPAGAPLPRAGRPLLKWAGGKRQLLPAFRAFYPHRFDRYLEPFLGSGAVFFDLHAAGRLTGHDVRLADSNTDLIGCYTAVREQPEAVIDGLARLADAHARNGAACYYEVRERFNTLRRSCGPAGAPCSAALAAMLIYLNRTGFNGLYRVNQHGAFNVPAGRYARPRILDAGLVRATAAALGRPGVRLEVLSFMEAVADARRDDLLYFDPPYAPLSPTSAFDAYTAPRFTGEDQRRLCDTVVDLACLGAHVMLSNSSAPDIDAMYRRVAVPGTGLALWRLPARRAINSRAMLRGPVHELLLTTLAPRQADLPPLVERLA